MLALPIVAIVLASLSFIGVAAIWIYLTQVRKRFLVRARERINQERQGQPSQGAQNDTTFREIGGSKTRRSAG